MEESGRARYVAERLSPDFGFYLRESRQLAKVNSAWQKIEILENPLFGRVMRIDDCFMTSERDEFLPRTDGASAGNQPWQSASSPDCRRR